ncbi:hypothetical protein [Phocaeicola vulgatus]|uniref:hypothetical protein n=1 Tax=Phocaeicola vulgatus TaxID=821 RepID=UPI001F35DCB8|nr:hypothetical protein [Phocaeicola vulgatus]MCG0295723.1 hypothetical protein [Phocaeicola vulgatus]
MAGFDFQETFRIFESEIEHNGGIYRRLKKQKRICTPYGITIEILVRNILHTILFGSIHFLVGLLYGHVNGV